MRIKNPTVVTDRRFRTRLVVTADAFDLGVVLSKVYPNVNPFQHRFMLDWLVEEWKEQEDWQTVVCPVLILTGTVNLDIIVDCGSPVGVMIPGTTMEELCWA